MNAQYHYKSPTWVNYIWQPAIIFIFLAVILNIFFIAEHSVSAVWAVGAGSLASSSYLVFAKPSATSANPSRLIVAYVIAILCGLLMHYFGHDLFFLSEKLCREGILAALAVVITMMLMIWLHIEHPPAVGMALVFVIDLKDYRISIIVIGAITVMVMLKLLLNRWLRDLF